MPRGALTKDDVINHILKIKRGVYEDSNYYENPKDMTNHYLNLILSKLNEYAR